MSVISRDENRAINNEIVAKCVAIGMSDLDIYNNHKHFKCRKVVNEIVQLLKLKYNCSNRFDLINVLISDFGYKGITIQDSDVILSNGQYEVFNNVSKYYNDNSKGNIFNAIRKKLCLRNKYEVVSYAIQCK